MSDSEVDIDDASSFEDKSFGGDASDDDDVMVVDKKKAVAKGKPASSGSASGALALNKNADNVPKASAKGKKTVEETYQKKTMREHILLRPDTYIGSTERVTEPMFVLDEANGRIVKREITYTPGLFKIFDEIIVNAADNKQRDPNMDKLDITIDPTTNTISVLNNGKGIPVVIHKEHKCYVPTMIFSQFLTGSNFDDDERKTTGGRNGYGSKLTNVFSTMFTVECVDTENGVKFKQVFENNLIKKGDPIVKKCTAAELKKGDFVKITFSPDLARFHMDSLDDDTVALLSKRAYDVAGTMVARNGKKLSVTLNGKKITVSSFKDYLKLFDGICQPAVFEKIGERWEVGVGISEGSAQQISFVNAISTSKGGKHVVYIADQVATHLAAVVKKKNKGGSEIKPNIIKNHLFVFVNCLIENPAFDSQTKENLITNRSDFGSTCKLSEKFLKTVEKSGVVESILSYAKYRQGLALKRTGGVKKVKLTGIAKLDDANFAGTKDSKDCTLIVTEGDSAKSLAMSGLSIVGRDYFGVFPLRGKLLNVRDANLGMVSKNEEIKNIVDILGLKYNTTYDATNIKNLRYGHLMIMADQDHDGSHIKGLVINFIHHFWPSLLDVPGFIQQFITPIVKVTKGKKSMTFFTLPQYEEWKKSTGNNAKGYNVKYYKGLGTSTSSEAKEYFSNLPLHRVLFDVLSKDVVEPDQALSELEFDGDVVPDKAASGADLIDLAFRKDRAEDRKNWMTVNLKNDPFVDYTVARRKGLKYSEFINKELILFSQSDCQRSIPHVMDGFKPSQRKVLFACIKRKLKAEIKVAQLAGYIGEHTAYHHGEASLHGAIVNMAQSFCGSNNVNLLTPSGQFGTRRMGGKDAASPRYIFTRLEAITRTIFHPDDDELLTYLNDDGISIEPEYFMPVIPMALVNGSDGIGTGWSTSIPNYDPRDIIDNIRRMIAGEPLVQMCPRYYGFTGDIVPTTNGSFEVRGKIERLDDTTVHISELPLKKWTQDYKQFLEETLTNSSGEASEKKSNEKLPKISDFKENHTDSTVSFTITAEKSDLDKYETEKGGLLAKFKLTGSVSTSNMHLFDTDGVIAKYPNPEAILNAFYQLRLEFYDKRKALLLSKLRREQRMLSNKARFVEEVCSGDLVVSNRKRAVILAELKSRSYELFDKDSKAKSNEGGDDEEEGEEDELSDSDGDGENLAKGYEYLLGMKIWSLTFEKAEELRKQLREKTKLVVDLEATTPSQIWLNDLDAVEEALEKRDDEIKSSSADQKKAQVRSQQQQAKTASKNAAAAKRTKPKKKAADWDSEADDDEPVIELDSDATDKQAEKAKLIPKQNQKKPTRAPATRVTILKTAKDVPRLPKPMQEPLLDTELPGGANKPKKNAPKSKSGSTVAEQVQVLSSDDEFDFAMDTDSVEEITRKDAKQIAKQTLRSKKQSQNPYPIDKPATKAFNKSSSLNKEDACGGSDSEVEESLMERMKKKLLASVPSQKAVGTFMKPVEASRGMKRPSSPTRSERSQLDDFESLGMKGASDTTKKMGQPKPKPKPPAKKVKSNSGVTKTEPTKGRAQPKRKTYESSSSEAEVFEESDDSDTAMPVILEEASAPPARARAARARKQVKYVLSDDESNDDSDSSIE